MREVSQEGIVLHMNVDSNALDAAKISGLLMYSEACTLFLYRWCIKSHAPSHWSLQILPPTMHCLLATSGLTIWTQCHQILAVTLQPEKMLWSKKALQSLRSLQTLTSSETKAIVIFRTWKSVRTSLFTIARNERLIQNLPQSSRIGKGSMKRSARKRRMSEKKR